VTGFDLFYALFDVGIDRAQGLHSAAVTFGARGSILAARLCHAATVALLVVAGLGLPVNAFYWIGVAVVAALLAYEHSLVRPGDLKRLDTAFFTMNGVISLAFLAFVILDAVT
jgi:4-hydroxybenzoate polyprenyltransferase